MFGLVAGAGFIGWGVFGYKRSRRTAFELLIGRTRLGRWAAVLTVGFGVLFTLSGLGGILVQREEAARKEQAAAAAQKRAAQEAAHRKQLQPSLLAEAPAKAAAWKASLTSIASGMPSVKTNDLRRKLGELNALRDQAKTWLAQLDVKPRDAEAAEAEIESKSNQVQAAVDFVDGAAAFDTAFQDARALIAKRSWIEADQALDEVLQRVPALQAADPSFRAFVVGGFDPARKKAQVAAAKAGIAGAVAAEKKREEAAQAYRALCGEAPVVSSWDGALVGLTSAIKETANDPDSIDVSRCTQPELTKGSCWVSTCNVRGKNGFGGMILLRQTWSYSKLLGFRQVK